MQSIQRFTRHQSNVGVRISRLVVVCILPLVSYAQQLPTPTQTQAQRPPQAQEQPPAQKQQLPPEPQQQLPMQQCSLSAPGRCAMGIAKDQRNIFTSPFRLRRKDLVWLVPLAGATSAAFLFDRSALEHVSTDPSRVNDFRLASNITGIYVPVAAAGGALLTGTLGHDEHLRETGMLAMTAMIDTQLLATFIKFGADRARPSATGLTSSSGAFWPNGHSSSADSFPSGHAANAFAVAHVIADEYPSWKVKLAVYGLAAATGFERVAGREHFPSDVLVGGAIGYLVGGYVFNHHSTRSKNHIAIAPMVGHGGAGVSLQFSRDKN
jgi:hypothetical protein